MKRFLAALGSEIVRQYRHGFYAVSIVLVLLFGWLLRLLPEASLPSWLLPALVALSLLLTTFFFIGALVLLEKAEGVLWALATSPLRGAEYLAAKVVSLSVLALAETSLLLAIGFGPRALTVELLLGGAALGVLYSLAGFITIARNDSFNEYFLPAIGVTILLLAPLLHLGGLVSTPLALLHPAYPALLLMQSGYAVTPVWQLWYAGSLSLLWPLLAAGAALSVQRRYLEGRGRGIPGAPAGRQP